MCAMESLSEIESALVWLFGDSRSPIAKKVFAGPRSLIMTHEMIPFSSANQVVLLLAPKDTTGMGC